MRAFILLVALLIGLGSAALPAVAADDIAAAQDVIRSQEQALARDDAAAAYSYAAPAIREIFPQADMFLQMVQHGYAPVYRHKSFEFGESASKTARSRSASISSTTRARRGKRSTHWKPRRTAA